MCIPPITATEKICEFNEFNLDINNLLNHDNYYTKFNTNMTAKICPKTIAYHNKIIEELTQLENNI